MRAREARLRPGSVVELTSPRTRRRVRCTVGERVGEGGSALVYGGALAEDGTQVVLKCQRYAGAPDPAFEHEVRLFRTLAHRNIIHCVGVGVSRQGHLVLGFRRAYPNPLFTLADERIAKELRLDAKATYPNLPLDTAIDLGYELLRALRHLERQGLVHHDVKLANLLVDVGPEKERLRAREVFSRVVRRKYRGVLIDFGATRSREELERLNAGEVEGLRPPQLTPLYAPPEAVVERRRADGSLGRIFHPSIDAYAAAMVIYAMITGHPPYSHLQTPVDPHDFESIVSVKSAEGRGEIVPVSADVLQRTLHQGTSFLSPREEFDLGLYRFLAQRLSPDPAQRGTITDMVLDFERLMKIDDGRAESGVHSLSGVTGKAYLPFQQGLVRVGEGAGEHPLLKAARLYGETTHFDRLPEEALAEPEPNREEAAGSGPTFDERSGLTFLDEMWGGDDEPSSAGKGRGRNARSQAKTRSFSRSETHAHLRSARARRAAEASTPEDEEPEADEGERAALLARALGAGEEGPAAAPERRPLSFYGSAAGLGARLLARAGLLLAAVGTLATLSAQFLLRAPPDSLPGQWVQQAETLVGPPAAWPWVGDAWTRLSPELARIPALSLVCALVVLLILADRLSTSLRNYRWLHTSVFGSTLVHRPAGGLGRSLLHALGLLLSGGLLVPWLAVRRKRDFFCACRTASGATLGFRGGGLAWAGLALLSLLLLPVVVCTLGLAGIPLSYAWQRWEAAHLLLPDAEGKQHTPRCVGSLGAYFVFSLPGWLVSVLSAGLARPWAQARAWRWFDRHLVV